jgi:single-strand DNA-binding protein
MGNLGKDPETFGFDGRNGRSEGVKFPVAVNRGKDDNKVTDWYECLCFGQTAKTAKEWLQKGKAVIVFGKLSIREWEGKDGKKGHSTEVIADDIQFVPWGRLRELPNDGSGIGFHAAACISAHCTIRDGGHSRCAWWLLGRCSRLVMAIPRPRLRTCDATRTLWCRISTVVTVARISTTCCTRLYGTL